MTEKNNPPRPALFDGVRRYFLSLSGPTMIGKQGCAILLADPSIALQHARLQSSVNGFSVEAVGAEVRVNDLAISTPTVLKPGDKVTLGIVELTYEGPDVSQQGAEQKLSYDELFEKVKSCVVSIRTPGGLGSGFFIHPTGLIVSNRHVVGYERDVEIHLVDGKQLVGRVMRSYPEMDLAFIQASLASNFVPSFVSPATVRVGQAVLVIGHPLGLANTLTRGIISAVNREVMGNVYIQTDAAINPGNSGGPIFNESGEIIGVATMSIGNSQGLNFAIPAEQVHRRMELFLIEEARVQRGQGVYCIVCGYFCTGGVYCPNCGVSFEHRLAAATAPAVATQQCSKCGKPLSPGDQFCSACGTHL